MIRPSGLWCCWCGICTVQLNVRVTHLGVITQKLDYLWGQAPHDVA